MHRRDSLLQALAAAIGLGDFQTPPADVTAAFVAPHQRSRRGSVMISMRSNLPTRSKANCAA